MLIKLLKTARVTMGPGTVVDVSPDQANFLFSTGSAEAVATTAAPKTAEPEKEKTPAKKPAKK